MGLPEELINRLAPLTLATNRVLPVPEELTSLFPWGGIQRGWSVGVAGSAAWSLAFSIWAKALGSEGWVAVIGVPDLGLAAAAELGVRLDRVVLVQTPPATQWGTVVSSALDAFDVVAVAPTAPVSPRDARRLSARAREREVVLFHLDGGRTWPSALDLTLHCRTEDCRSEGWTGLGWGHGYLQGRRVSIDAVGRRTGRPRSLSVLLPDASGRLAAVPEQHAVPEEATLPALV